MTGFGESSYRPDLKEPGVLEDIIRTYAQPLIRYAYTLIGSSTAAEDAMEDAIAALCIKTGSFKSQEQLRSWLYKTTRNKAIDHLRRHKKEVPLSDVENVLHTWDAEQDLLVRERNCRLYACMQKLPQQYRDVLQLSYFEGFEVDEICMILHKNTKQVYNLLARAKASLKELLIKEGVSHEDLR